MAVVIACRIVEKEVETIMAEENLDHTIIWLDSGLHDRPKNLKEELKKVLDEVTDDLVILTFGLCGESTLDLCANGRELILPRTDDCISMLLGSQSRRKQLNAELAALYLTEGWTNGTKTPLSEYEHAKEKYDEETADMIMEMMYQHYRTLALIDNGITDMEEFARICQPIAEISGTEEKIIDGTLDWIRTLLTGPWDEERFIVKHGDEVLTMADFTER